MNLYLLQANTKKAKGHERSFIPPRSIAKFLKMNKKQQEALMGNDELESVSKALEIVKKGPSNCFLFISIYFNIAQQLVLLL